MIRMSEKGAKKNIEELYKSIFAIREALQDATQLAAEAAVMSDAFGGEIARVITEQLNTYFIPAISKYIDNEAQPGAVAPIITFLDSVPLAMTRQEAEPVQTTPAPIQPEAAANLAAPIEGSYAAKQESRKHEGMGADDAAEWRRQVAEDDELTGDSWKGSPKDYDDDTAVLTIKYEWDSGACSDEEAAQALMDDGYSEDEAVMKVASWDDADTAVMKEAFDNWIEDNDDDEWDLGSALATDIDDEEAWVGKMEAAGAKRISPEEQAAFAGANQYDPRKVNSLGDAGGPMDEAIDQKSYDLQASDVSKIKAALKATRITPEEALVADQGYGKARAAELVSKWPFGKASYSESTDGGEWGVYRVGSSIGSETKDAPKSTLVNTYDCEASAKAAAMDLDCTITTGERKSNGMKYVAKKLTEPAKKDGKSQAALKQPASLQ